MVFFTIDNCVAGLFFFPVQSGKLLKEENMSMKSNPAKRERERESGLSLTFSRLQ